MNAISQKVLPTRRKRIALYSSDTQFRREVAVRLESLAIYDVQVADATAFLRGAAPDAKPTVIILDVGDGEILLEPALSTARASWASIPLIAVSAELAPDRMRNLVRINASDWLHKPLDGKDLLNAVTFHDSGSHASRSRVVTFVSASGGAGATTLALSAAKHIGDKSAQHAAGTCLVDLDFQSASCGAYLNLSNQFDIEGIIGQPDRLDVELMDVIKLTRQPGFTIYSFERPSLPFEPTGRDFVLKLLDLVAYRFENVIVDLPNLETPWQSSVLSTSDEIFVVFELNVASLRQAKRLYTRIREIKGNTASVTLVANKHKRKLFGNHFSKGELEKIFAAKHIKTVAFDPDLMSDALNRAMLPVEIHRRARLNRDLKRIFEERVDAS
ncbi:response regulator/pilus assembly protein [Mesorhizobium sp. YM1C-6-2]|uniref:AAA family ATPase n=1 Tax=Mesorhizobium sp. YM1C-6-2 TaxID=1827501 RepID=UPI000EF26A43|nr:response regulator/pilus assembly protein [Mesorhizobium sp. YM1C-6-2]RLP26004.1 pilus assembly protein [Mesorhizobium sp. YM1C-6-2]